jgi:glutathione S-transferase
MEKIKFTYFDIDGGRGETTRIVMSIGGIEFEDHRLSFPEFREIREGTPLNAVPTVEINGVSYTQCNAMNRYFGKQAGLYPTDPWQAFLCDEVLEMIEDMSLAARRTFGLDGDELVEAREKLMSGPFKRGLQMLAKRLEAAGSEWFAENKFTVADIKVFIWIRHLKSGVLDHVPGDYPDQIAPSLVQHMERVAAQPGVAEYYKGRGK